MKGKHGYELEALRASLIDYVTDQRCLRRTLTLLWSKV